MTPFQPATAGTVLIDISASNQRVSFAKTNIQQVRVMNNGSATVWVEFGDVTATASLTASYPVGPGVTEIVTPTWANNGATLYAAAIAAGTTGKVYFTPGSGI